MAVWLPLEASAEGERCRRPVDSLPRHVILADGELDEEAAVELVGACPRGGAGIAHGRICGSAAQSHLPAPEPSGKTKRVPGATRPSPSVSMKSPSRPRRSARGGRARRCRSRLRGWCRRTPDRRLPAASSRARSGESRRGTGGCEASQPPPRTTGRGTCPTRPRRPARPVAIRARRGRRATPARRSPPGTRAGCFSRRCGASSSGRCAVREIAPRRGRRTASTNRTRPWGTSGPRHGAGRRALARLGAAAGAHHWSRSSTAARKSSMGKLGPGSVWPPPFGG
jgi:hypothetical protein